MAAPQVSSLAPASGDVGTAITISGSGFTGATAVNFGSVSAQNFTVNSDTEIDVEAPEVDLCGGVNVTVANADGTSDTNADAVFEYADTSTKTQNKCCITTFNVPTARSGCTTEAASSTRNKMGERFNMEIDFDSSGAGCVCSCCEYRQLIRGTFTANGTNIVHLLPNPAGGAPLRMLPRPATGATDDNFLEDGIPTPPSGTNVYYGHRSEGSTDSTDTYLPDRATGCQYRGNDFPGLTGPTGMTVSIDLDFRGQCVDTCNANASVQQNDWTVTCSGTL